MTSSTDLSRCYAFINCQLHPPGAAERLSSHAQLRPSLAISRQTGCGSKEIADKLAEFLQAKAPAPNGWAVFDKNIVVRMLEEHHLPPELARFIPENRIPIIRDMMEQLLGLHPPSDVLIEQVGNTVRRLAEVGNVILMGRAANVITRSLPNVFHLRLVAPIEKRAARVSAQANISQELAIDYIKREDAARKRYVKDYFKADIDDLMLYDLVLNTARLSTDHAAKLIGETLLVWAAKL